MCQYQAQNRWNAIHITEHYHKLWCNFFFTLLLSKYITIILYLSITLGILFFNLHIEKIWQMGINSQVIYLFLGRNIVIYKGCSLLFSFSTKEKKISLPSLPFSSEDQEQTIATFFFLNCILWKVFFFWGLKVNFLNLIFISIKIWTQYFKPTSIHNYIISWFTVDDLICCNLFSWLRCRLSVKQNSTDIWGLVCSKTYSW